MYEMSEQYCLMMEAIISCSWLLVTGVTYVWICLHRTADHSSSHGLQLIAVKAPPSAQGQDFWQGGRCLKEIHLVTNSLPQFMLHDVQMEYLYLN
jgi:hypothetical protein